MGSAPVNLSAIDSGGGVRLYFAPASRESLEQSATRIWKRLGRDDRLAAARHFFAQPPAESYGSAIAAIVSARHARPQVVRSMPPEEQARALASVNDLGEAVASSLLVALHLGERRAMLAAFLDAAGVPHQDGILNDEGDMEPLSEEAARAGMQALLRQFTREQVEVYFNTLWLQDPVRWRVLQRAMEWS